MEFNYDNNPNRGCRSPFKELIMSAVIMLALVGLGLLVFTGPSASIVLLFVAPPFCFVPWLIIALLLGGWKKLGES